MIQKFVDNFMAAKSEIRAAIKAEPPDAYSDLVKMVLPYLSDDIDYKKLEIIDHGEYQGTLLFVVPENRYQPDKYWYVKVYYGSCSGCDTLEEIRCYSADTPTDEDLDKYMTLALHIVQGLKEI